MKYILFWNKESAADSVKFAADSLYDSPVFIILLIATLVLGLPFTAAAHDIPADLTIQAFVKPQGQQLHLLVRAPLKAMADVEFPRRGPGYLDLARIDKSLRDAATIWISRQIEVYEGDDQLSEPQIVEARVSLPSDKSFASYEEAVAHLTDQRLTNDTDLVWDQALIDVLFDYPIRSDQSAFSIRSGLARLGLRVVTVLRFLPPNLCIVSPSAQSSPHSLRHNRTRTARADIHPAPSRYHFRAPPEFPSRFPARGPQSFRRRDSEIGRRLL